MIKRKLLAFFLTICLFTTVGSRPAKAWIDPYLRDCIKFTGAIMAGVAPTYELIATSGFMAELMSFVAKQGAMLAEFYQEFATKQAFFEDSDPGKRPYVRVPESKYKTDVSFADVNSLIYDRVEKNLPANYATADIFDYPAADHIKRHVEKQLLDFPGSDNFSSRSQDEARYVTTRETLLRNYVEAAALRGKLKHEMKPIINDIQHTLMGYNNDFNQNVIATVTISEAATQVAVISARASALASKANAMMGVFRETQLLTRDRKKPDPDITAFDF